MENNNFKIGDTVWIEGKSIQQLKCSGCIGTELEEVKILKITPKRFKVEWNCEGQLEKPIVIYVKKVYKTN